MATTDYPSVIASWLRADTQRWQALEVAASLQLPDWCLAAGFVRNLVWDHLHNKPQPTPLNDIDVVYFNTEDVNAASDQTYQQQLYGKSPFPWSVKNQARMHTRNQDKPYLSTADAMRHWVEIETAVGVRLNNSRELEFIAPFGLAPLFALSVTLNQHCPKPAVFRQRINNKHWLATWPKLQVNNTI
ncbi:nucleotidyltransferase family protein [Alteromonas gilva]|uniref:Nucleotidyltransferase family protein n=1 Tax=Alteromonas gilva TaxID=2987522 RepID=A0ABT5KXN9_9ALTE|nr:nucleotidyltransferase family protein [Alteromonas gilva]MDC8829530.1 nucleotidyltransferase family protein [Alteromonas gilva]